jgi:uncharacterized protein (DUF302 family)
MKKMFSMFIAALVAITMLGCNGSEPKPFKPSKPQDVQVMSAENSGGKITKDSIEAAFKSAGFNIDGNNDMNKAFEKRFKGGDDFKMYRLMFVHNPKLVAKLAKEFPSIGLISPLSTSVYSKDGKNIKISSLTLKGMSKITKIPETNKDLIALSNNLTTAVKAALPNGSFDPIDFKIKKPNGALVTTFEAAIEADDEGDYEDEKEGFQEEMEAEIESLGFIVAGFVGLNDELRDNGVDTYDFYDTYSICKLEVIYPVHKTHPEVGAYAPCTLYMYKKKGEETTHMGFPSVQNWISSTDIEDEYSLKPLIDAQNKLDSTIRSLTE